MPDIGLPATYPIGSSTTIVDRHGIRLVVTMSRRRASPLFGFPPFNTMLFYMTKVTYR